MFTGRRANVSNLLQQYGIVLGQKIREAYKQRNTLEMVSFAQDRNRNKM